jgi:hypothetical protein
MFVPRLKNPETAILIALALALLFAVSYGSAAPPTPTEAPAAPQERLPAPVGPREGASASTGGGSQPTATPAPVTQSQEVEAQQVTRLRYAIGGVDNETNRPWSGSRQAYVQYTRCSITSSA